jgi:hypothetical protein
MTLRVSTDTVGDMLVRELAEFGGQMIVRDGGTPVHSTQGTRCFPRRIDARIPIEVFDPHRGCSRRVIARVRLTVELPDG